MSWKGYAQDLGQPRSGRRSAARAGVQYCGAPSPSRAPPAPPRRPTPAALTPPTSTCPSTSRSSGLSRSCGSGDCNAKHIANVFSTSSGLVHDLKHESTTPAFSWITPDNCSDAHDAVCHGNNLSGGFADPNTPRAPRQLHRRAVCRRPVPGPRRPRDRSVEGLQGRRPHRHHLRRGVPAVHLHRQQLRQLDAGAAQCRAPRSRTIPRARRCSAAPFIPSRPGPTRRWRPTSRATSCSRAPVTTPSSTAPATASPRPRRSSRRARACSVAATASRRPHRRRRHRARGQLHDR